MSRPELDIARVRAITFDSGGTLITPHPGVGEIYAEILAGHEIPLAPSLINLRFREAFKELTAGQPRAVVNEATDLAFWREIVRRSVSPECPPGKLEEVFNQMWHEFASARRWRPLPGATETLAALSDRKNLPLGILSNWDRRLHQVIDELGWRRYLAGGVFISSELGAEKPDPRAFRAVEKSLHLPASAFLHVGDSETHDYLAARAAGWQALLVSANSTNDLPWIASLAELPDLL